MQTDEQGAGKKLYTVTTPQGRLLIEAISNADAAERAESTGFEARSVEVAAHGLRGTPLSTSQRRFVISTAAGRWIIESASREQAER